MAVRGFVSMRIMHCLAVKFRSAITRVFSTSRRRTVIAVAIIQMMVDVAIEMISAVVPRACTDKHAAVEPFRTIVAIGSAGVRWRLVITVRADWRLADLYCNLS